MIKIIRKGKEVAKISTAVVSTILGHNGRGMFPYCYLPGHSFLMDVIETNQVTVITKSWTRYSHRGNYVAYNPFTWRYIQRLDPRSMINSYGLTNQGAEAHWDDAKKSIRQGLQICPSLYPEFNKGPGVATERVLEMISYCKDSGLIEINLSCPNSKEKVGANDESIIHCLKRIRGVYPQIGVIAKMGVTHCDELYQEINKLRLIDAFHCFNAVPYELLFPGQKSPLPNGAGAVSGAHIKKTREKRLKQVLALTDIAIIAGGGIESTFDIEQCLNLGAAAVSFCTSVAYSMRDSAIMIRDTVSGDS